MKELTKTPFITALLAKAAGEDVDMNKLHVYEVRATSTVPFRGKGGTIFEKGRISPHTIALLARSINEEAVPLMMDHNMSGTPYGKFFYAEAIPMDNGETELRGYMYVDDSETQILAKLEASSIDEVSIQFLSERMLCSECGFDYFEAVANGDFMPIMTHTCENGHEVGQNGVHVNLVGVAEVIELSLVSRGAAKNSKIIGASDAMLGESAQRLAANGVDVLNNYYCTASINDEDEDEGVSDVDLKEFTTALAAAATEKADLTVQLNATTAERDSAVAERDAAITARDEATEQVTQLQAQIDEVAEPEFDEETTTALKAYIGKQYTALKALDGEADATAPDDIAEAVRFISENEARLSALIPAEGASTPAGKNTSDKPTQPNVAALSAFKS